MTDLPDLPREGRSGLPISSEAARPGTLAPALDAYAQDDEGPSVDWRRYMAAIVRHKWLILLFTVLGTAAGWAASEFLPVSYRAEATIWIEQNDGGDRGPIRSDQLLQASAWQELLQSFVVLDHVVLDQRLYLKTDVPKDSALFAGFRLQDRFRPGSYRLTVQADGQSYALTTAEGGRLETGRLGRPIGREIGFDWTPEPGSIKPGEEVEFDIEVPREVALELKADMRPQMDRTGTLLLVELSMPTAEQAADVLNAIADRYLEVAADLKRARLDELTGILGEQLAYADSQLTARERELEGFRISTITLPSERATPVTPGLEITRDPVFGSYFERKVQLEQLREDRAAIEAALGGQDGSLSVQALEVVPSVQTSSELTAALGQLAQLRSELRMQLLSLTEEHPTVIGIQEDIREMERTTIPGIARGLVAQLNARERALTDLIDSASTQLRDIPSRAIEEARLRRSVAIAENLYTQLQQKHEESRLAAASALPDVSVLDPASVPSQPVRDDKPMVILLAFGGSLGLALLGAVLRDRTDQTIRYPGQVTDEMGLQVLGALPRTRSKNGQIDTEMLPALTEALRGIRLSLAYTHGTAGPLMLTVSSPGPSDGKTFFTSNLGLSFSMLGKRTLIIDGDIRRGTLHRVLNAERVPGLTDYLAGEAGLDQVVKSTGHTDLDILPSGTRRHIGPELLGSAEMKKLILEMRSRYDVVLVDSPPLAAGVDPLILSTLTGSMALVLRTGSTKRSLASSQLELLQRLPVRMLGAILNDVDHGEGGYYQYEKYLYLPNYRVEEEEEAEARAGGQPALMSTNGRAHEHEPV